MIFQGWPEAGALRLAWPWSRDAEDFLQETIMTMESGLVRTWKGYNARLNILSPLEIPQWLPQVPYFNSSQAL